MAARETEGLEAGLRVLEDAAERVVVDALDGATGLSLDDETEAADVVADEAIGVSTSPRATDSELHSVTRWPPRPWRSTALRGTANPAP